MKLSDRAAPTVATLLALLTLTACGDVQYITVGEKDPRRPVGAGCVLDDQCEGGRCIAGSCDDGLCGADAECAADEICVFGACTPSDTFACHPGQRPLLSLSPLSIEFGEVSLGNTGSEVVTLGNDGDCLLTVSGISLPSDGDPGFACEPCDVTQFPQRIPPQRTLDVHVTFSPPSPGEASSQVLVRSDDTTAGDSSAGNGGLIAVDLHASYSGVPVLVLDPQELSFGYVEYAAGGVQGARTESVKIMNQGSGNATLTVQFIYITPGTDFSLPPEFAGVSPAAPRLLPPYNPNDPTTWIEVPVTFRPTHNANQQTQLFVNAHAGDPTAAVNVSALLSASSLGPPRIAVSETELEYQQDDGLAYPVGSVNYRQVFISNSGQSDLAVNVSLAGEAGDFSLSPPFIAPIPPGGMFPLTVFYNPSAPSDPANPHEPTQPINAVLNVTSNDTDPTSDVLKTVALRGWARGGTFDDLLKLEMTYENADNSWAGSDYRDVDLELVSPLGLSCAKPQLHYREQPINSGNYILDNTTDFCAQWNGVDVDNDGRPENGTASWLALGAYEEPERILLYGLGQDLADGQTFQVRAHYIEDCANMPSGLLGDLLGIGASALLGVLGGSIGVPILVPPDQISNLITQNCWDAASSLVTLHISINGEEVAAPQQRIHSKGDTLDLVRLKRQDGQFVVLP